MHDGSQESDKRIAFLRHHFRMTKRQWDKQKFKDTEIIEMWAEFCFIETAYGRMKKPDSEQ